MLRRISHRGVVLTSIVLCGLAAAPAHAEILGATLPAPARAGITGNLVNTFVTPYVAEEGGPATCWRTEFYGGAINGRWDGPMGVQLKVFRHESPTVVRVQAAGVVHDPGPELLARFGSPFFPLQQSALEFSDPGLVFQPGDVVGITIKSDPILGLYQFPLVGTGDTPLVLRDVGVGSTIDLTDPNNTVHFSNSPAVEVALGEGCPAPVDTSPPEIYVPDAMSVPATGSDGASVFWDVIANDTVDWRPTVECSPQSGETLPIGDTIVTCTATDASENSASASFGIHVQGAAEQVGSLVEILNSYALTGLGTSLKDKLVATEGYLASNRTAKACGMLGAFVHEVTAQHAKTLDDWQTWELTTSAERIQAVIGC